MLNSPLPLRFSTDAEKFLVFNLHSESKLESVQSVLNRSPAFAPPIILIGDEGIGRHYLLQAVVFQNNQKGGKRLKVIELNLDGFEPDQSDAFPKYLDHLAKKGTGVDARRWGQIKNSILDTKIKLTVRTAFLFSLAIESTLAVKDVWSLLFGSAQGPDAPDFIASDSAGQVIRSLFAGDSLVFHLRNIDSVPAILIEWLFRWRNRGLDVYIAFSASKISKVALPIEPSRIELFPLNREELRAVIETRFFPNEFSKDIPELLYLYSQGWPSLISVKMAALQASHLITCRADGMWLSDYATDEVLVSHFEDGILDQFRNLLASEQLDRRVVFEKILSIGALCRKSFPIRPVLEFLNLNREQWEVLIDALDSLFDPILILEDHEYSHPGFPGELVYSFRNSVVPKALLNAMDAAEREDLAAKLLRFFGARFIQRTRSQQLLLLNLAGEARLEDISEGLSHDLQLFATIEDADSLSELLAERIRAGTLSASHALEFESRNRASLPLAVRLALLNAVLELSFVDVESQTSRISIEQLATCQESRALCLLNLGLYQQSFDQICEAIICRNQVTRIGALLTLRGWCQWGLSRFEESQLDWSAALVVLGNQRFKVTGYPGESKKYKERWMNPSDPDGIVIRPPDFPASWFMPSFLKPHLIVPDFGTVVTQIAGTHSKFEKYSKNGIALRLIEVGEFDHAIRMLKEDLSLHLETLGTQHPRTLARKVNLAYALWSSSSGDSTLAESVWKEVEADVKLLGFEFSATDPIVARCNIAEFFLRVGDFQAERELYEVL